MTALVSAHRPGARRGRQDGARPQLRPGAGQPRRRRARAAHAASRHPIYTGYLITHVGFLLAHPTPWNVAVILIADTALILRALMEERVLSADARVSGVLPARRLAPRAGGVLMNAVALINERTRAAVATGGAWHSTRGRRAGAGLLGRDRLETPAALMLDAVPGRPHRRHALRHRRRVPRSRRLRGEDRPRTWRRGGLPLARARTASSRWRPAARARSTSRSAIAWLPLDRGTPRAPPEAGPGGRAAEPWRRPPARLPAD